MLNMALDMQIAIDEINEELGSELAMRIGISCGPVFGGIIGRTKFQFDIWGPVAEKAEHMESSGVCQAVQLTAEAFETIDGSDYKVRASTVEDGAVIINGRAEKKSLSRDSEQQENNQAKEEGSDLQ